MLDAVDARAADAVTAGDPPTALYTYGVDVEYGIDVERSATDRAVAAALVRRGYRAIAPPGGLLERDLDDLPAPDPPT